MDPRYLNLDAAQSVFFSRQLEHIKSELYEVRYPELKSRQYIPVDSSAGDGVDTIVTRQEDTHGEAKIISDYADDLPRADVSGTEVSYPVRDLGSSFGFSVREIRAAARNGIDLSGRKAKAARKAQEVLLDTIGATGDTAAGLHGFINNALVTPAAVAVGLWTAKTPDQILADINEAVSSIRTTTKGIHSPSTVLVPEAQYTLLAQTRMTDLNVTILKYFLSTSPFIKEILPWYRLEGAGAAAADRMIVYDRSSDVMQLQVPVEFEQMEPQARGLEHVVPTRMATGGVTMHRPGAVAFRDGI